MVSHVEGTYPKEGCGVMIGSDEAVTDRDPTAEMPTPDRRKTSSRSIRRTCGAPTSRLASEDWM